MGEPTPDNPEGLSKNQLKKLQKKAEKKAKKGDDGGGDDDEASPPAGAAAAAGNAPGKSAATAAAPPVPAAKPKKEKGPPPMWKLGHAKVTDPSTLKVAYASQLYGISVSAATRSEVKKQSSFWSDNKDHAVLMYGSHCVGGDGNAMAKALRMSTGSTCVPALDLLVEEWCEWERTVLRAASNEKQMTVALSYLEQGLQGSAPAVHLVGHSHSLADVVVSVTLEEVLEKYPTVVMPDLVELYRKAHQSNLEQAQEIAQKLQDEGNASNLQQLDLGNPSLMHNVIAIFQLAALPLVDGDEDMLPTNMITKCQNPKHGDYQCNAAMPIFAALKKAGKLPADVKSPQQIAQKLIEGVGAGHPVLTDLHVQGPGFVLCRIKGSYLQTHLSKWLAAGHLPKPPLKQTYECVVDFSSPNIAKEMHVGHLRSTIIGEAVCRILEFVGHHVHRTNHVGDWGTQFGMLIQYLKEEYPEVGSTAEVPNITDLTEFYKNAKARFDESPEFKKTAQTNVVKLQSGDEECLKVWQMLCDASRSEFQKVYDRLDVTLEEKGESFYNAKIPLVIKEFEQANMISIEEGGAKCVFVDGYRVPLMLQKSDGGFGYDSTDMAALKYRLFEIGAQRIIVITDYSQSDHFQMCYNAARKIGWIKKQQRLEHIGFGTVQGEDGKRFKTRSGDTVRLVDLLDEAVSRMEASLKQRIEEGKANITAEDVHDVAEAIGYGAVKYYDLRRNPTTNYSFSYDQMLDTKGNTAVYLLYARVRLDSICAKAKADHGVDVEELVNAGEVPIVEHESERNLVLQLQQFPDMMEQTLEDLFPYHICEYLYNLSVAASDFVTKCKVVGSPEMKSRLLLCHATVMAMHQCFDLLGIRHVKRI